MMKYRAVFQCLRRMKQFNSPLPHAQHTRFTATVAASKEVYFDEATLAAAKPFEDIPHFTILPFIGTAWLYLPIVGKLNFEAFKNL